MYTFKIDESNFITGTHMGPGLPAGNIETTYEDFNQVQTAGLRFDQGGGWRWQVIEGVLVESNDERPIVDFSLDKVAASTTDTINYTITVLDWQLNPINFNGTRKLYLDNPLGEKIFNVTIANGVKTGSKSFSIDGDWVLKSDTTYRVQGDTKFTIYQEW